MYKGYKEDKQLVKKILQYNKVDSYFIKFSGTDTKKLYKNLYKLVKLV